jgi:hypothetical protein
MVVPRSASVSGGGWLCFVGSRMTIAAAAAIVGCSRQTG